MSTRFLIAKTIEGELWAAVDADTLCAAPAVAPRRFAAYLVPFVDEPAARQALVEAGADSAAITAEPSRAKRVPRGKYETDACFAAVPLRALSDPRLTDRDVRILAIYAAHDQMSAVTKKGQGAWATQRTMAAKVGGEGANESNFSGSTTKLVSLGYLSEERQQLDRRRRTYRVIYSDEDALFWSKVSAERSSRDTLPAEQPSDCSETGISSQYIPQSKRYPAEAEKINSAEAARFAARGSPGIEFVGNVGAQLAVLERALKAGEQINAVEWYQYVGSIWEMEEHRGRAGRLAEQLASLMSDEEFEGCAL